MKGKPRSEETKNKISESLKGHIPWNKGRTGYSTSRKGKTGIYTQESIEKMRVAAIKDPTRHTRMIGENNPMWKNSMVYGTLHDWIKRRLEKPERCQRCQKNKVFDLANLSGKYLRDLSDWMYMCRSCHQKHDFATGIRKLTWGDKIWKTRRANQLPQQPINPPTVG